MTADLHTALAKIDAALKPADAVLGGGASAERLADVEAIRAEAETILERLIWGEPR